MTSLPLPPKIICRVRALYPYYSEEHSSLSFKKDDVIDVLAKLESGWWDGWCNGKRGWFPSNYVEVILDEAAVLSRPPPPPDAMLPPHPPMLQNYIDSNRVASSIHSSNSSEVSRNNANLPDGWTIQMAEDGQSWFYYNENTGKILNQHPGFNNNFDSENIIADHDSNLRSQRDSFLSDQSREPDYNTAADKTITTTKELMDNWVERKTPQGRIYYCNLVTQETTWDYEEIDKETGHLKKSQEEQEDEEDEEESEEEYPAHLAAMHRVSIQEDATPVEELTWHKLASDIAFSIHQLANAAQKGLHEELQPKTALIVESVRLMLYASRSMEKDAQLLQNPIFREPRRAVMSSLSKLVLSSKMGSEISEFSASIPTIFQKVQRDANDVLVAVRNFVTLCQQRNVTVSFVNPRLLDDITQLPYDPPSTATNNHCKTNTNGPSIERNHSSKSINAEEKKGFLTHSTELNTSLVQKAKYLLNQDLVLNLQAYSHQIYGSTEELSLIGSAVLKKAQKETSVEFHEERTNAVSMFRSLSSQISQYIGVLDEISLDSIDLHAPSISNYRISRQSLYTAIGQLFGAIQTLTDIHVSLGKAVQTINQSIVSVEDAIRSIEQSVVDMVNERKRTMGAVRDDFITVSPTASSIIPIRKPSVNDNGTSHFDHQGQLSPRSQDGFSELDGSEFGMRRGTIASFVSSNNSIVNSFKGTGDLASRMRQQSIRTDDRSFESNDVLGNDHHPDEIEFGSDNTVKGGTLAALVERLTIHDTLDTNFIATFLLTYRSFCTTEEFVSLLEARYNLLPPDRLTPNELEIWTERKQKLIRLRVFNVMKNWLENYYIDEDEPLLGRLEHFTNTNIRDTSSFAANQLLNLIKKRIELSSRGEMKKIIPNAISGPDPIYPKNMANIQLLETDPLEMARQLSILDFKLYSSIRPIELLGKAWSREGADGSVAINIKQSIQYCNQMTAWVTDSILSYEEAKKRAIVIKYWVQVADHCRSMNNFNTCMAILSAFDNSAVGRLKKTWMASSRSTTQTLAQIRKLMGANRNFADYREIVHSVNPPCIPFLGIYLQDLTFIEDGNPDFLPKCNNLINFAKRQKAAEVIRELKQFQNFAYNFHTIPEMQDFIKAYLDITHDVEQLYERSLQLEPRTTEVQAAVNNIMTNIV